MVLGRSNKEILISTIPNLAFIISFIVVYAFLPFKNAYSFTSLLILLSTIMLLIKDIKSKETPKIKKYSKSITTFLIVGTGLWLLTSWLGPLGFMGVVIIILLIVGVRLWMSRKNFVQGMRELESMVWGKPLDRKEWGEGEFRKTKIVFSSKEKVLKRKRGERGEGGGEDGGVI